LTDLELDVQLFSRCILTQTSSFGLYRGNYYAASVPQM